MPKIRVTSLMKVLQNILFNIRKYIYFRKKKKFNRANLRTAQSNNFTDYIFHCQIGFAKYSLPIIVPHHCFG